MLITANDCAARVSEGCRGALPLVVLVGGAPDELEDIAAAMEHPAVLAALPVADWNAELAPWPAPGLRAGPSFGGGAERTLARLDELCALLDELLPERGIRASARLLAGYSLGGLCALWMATRRSGFEGVGTMSGSLWYEGLCEYLAAHPAHVRYAYLSLGDREPRARDPRLARVGEGTQTVYELLRRAGIDACFEWNGGNHFADVPLRIARGADWLCARAAAHSAPVSAAGGPKG